MLVLQVRNLLDTLSQRIGTAGWSHLTIRRDVLGSWVGLNPVSSACSKEIRRI
jgi:hypothetical protein